MAAIRFTGWKPGLNTVHLIKLLREQANIPLNEAHALVNRLLSRDVLVFEVADEVDVERLVLAVSQLGAVAEVVRKGWTGPPATPVAVESA